MIFLPAFHKIHMSQQEWDLTIDGKINPAIEWVKNETQVRNSNFICMVLGLPGTGKSFYCLRFAEDIDPDFSCRNVFFTIPELLNAIENPSAYNLKSGSVLILEEGGVNVGARDHQSLVNKLMSTIIQTFRYQQFVLLINTPVGSFLDVNFRRVSHGFVAIDYRSESQKLSFGRFSLMKPLDLWKGVSIPVPLIVRNKEKGIEKNFRNFRCHLPSKKTIENYEGRSHIYKAGLASTAKKKINEHLNKDKQKPFVRRQVDLLPGMTISQDELDAMDTANIPRLGGHKESEEGVK